MSDPNPDPAELQGNDEVDTASGGAGAEGVEGDGAAEVDDSTIVVATADSTIAVARDDATIAVAKPADDAIADQHRTGGAGAAAHARPAPSARPAGAVGDPVVEREEIPPELAKLLFKEPLDSKRRAPASPFPAEPSSLPRGGVRGGIPVVYGARGEGFVGSAGARDLGSGLGAPPAGYEVPTAGRDALPSVARLNRTYGVVAWVGAFVVPVVAGVGLWWVLTQLLRP